MSGFLAQLLNGLASASTLFLIASGLSLIFGVTRVVNFAHGSLYMLGSYLAVSIVERLPYSALGFWTTMLLAALIVAVIGALIELLLLRRIYDAPELLQLLATFGVVLIVKDVALKLWGAEDILGPRAAGLSGSLRLGEISFPEYDLVLCLIGPAVWLLLRWLLTHTRWGVLVRAATQDREMVDALGVNPRWLFSSVFALGAGLAGLAGALQMPREPAHLALDMSAITDAFVVVVIGGLGSITGALLASLLIGVTKALCVGIGTVQWFGVDIAFSKLTLVVEFIIMAMVLVMRPWGLLGKPLAAVRSEVVAPPLMRPLSATFWRASAAAVALLALLPLIVDEYSLVLLVDILVFALFAASLHFLTGLGGLTSFGHAAYFGLGAYGAALLLLLAGMPMLLTLPLAALVAALAGLAFGWFAVRLSGVYLAMLTLAFAQIIWSIAFQWDSVTGGSNGLVGIWPSEWLAAKHAYYYLTLALCTLALWMLWRVSFAPFGYALRGARDSVLRAEAIGIDTRRVQWLSFALAGGCAGLAGALFAFSKGSISPESMAIARSVDALVMVLLGGVHTIVGPLIGAAALTWLQDAAVRYTEYWRGILGAVIVLLVLVFPRGIVGTLGGWWRREVPT